MNSALVVCGEGYQKKENTASRGSKQVIVQNGRRLRRERVQPSGYGSVSIRISWWRLRATQGLGWMFLSGMKEGFGKPWIGLCWDLLEEVIGNFYNRTQLPAATRLAIRFRSGQGL